MKTEYKLCLLQFIGDPDDGAQSAFTGLVTGNGEKDIASINEDLIIGVEQGLKAKDPLSLWCYEGHWCNTSMDYLMLGWLRKSNLKIGKA